MIIYGTKSTEINTEHLSDKCPNCGMNNTLKISIAQKYFHVFWIPFAPFTKTGQSHCASCKQILTPKELPYELKETYERLLKQSSTPTWTVTGIGMIAMITAWAFYQSGKHAELNSALINNPRKGDIYEIKKEQYALLKVRAIHGDTLFLSASKLETNKRTGLIKMIEKGEATFTEETTPMLKQQIKTMFENKEIIDIVRK
jgi:predicted RNA-binding Zn-ribbon protein involved in translation (DUF1610 family)